MSRRRRPMPPSPQETAAWVIREQERARDRDHDGRSTGYERERLEQQDQRAAGFVPQVNQIRAQASAGGWESTDTDVAAGCADDLVAQLANEITDD